MGVPERSNGPDLRSGGLVPAGVRFLSPTYNIKMSKKTLVYLLIMFILLITIINYNYIDNKITNFLIQEESKEVIVERVIDGDTIKYNDTSVRLLGINTPERGERYYLEAKKYLENRILNKTVTLNYGKEKKDLYGRELAYIYYSRENINKELIERGLANIYFPVGRELKYNEFLEAWIKCINKNINLCEKSYDNCAKCISLEDIDKYSQKIILKNNCDFDCNLSRWSIKDEGRKKFVFEDFILENKKEVEIIVGNSTNTKNKLFWKGETYVWTSSGDSLFLRDSKGKLVLWETI